MGLGLATIMVCMGALVRFIYIAERKMDRYSLRREGGSDREKTIQATKQGLAYIAVWLVSSQLPAVELPFYCANCQLPNLR